MRHEVGAKSERKSTEITIHGQNILHAKHLSHSGPQHVTAVPCLTTPAVNVRPSYHDCQARIRILTTSAESFLVAEGVTRRDRLEGEK